MIDQIPCYLEQCESYWIVKGEEGLGNAFCPKTSWSDRYLSLIAPYKVTDIRLNDRLGWSDTDISFLLRIPNLQCVSIISDTVTDVSVIFRLEKLKSVSLWCRNAKTAGDFEELRKLQTVALDWRNVYRSILKLNSLKRITLEHYPDDDLKGWNHNPRLGQLILSSSKLQSLRGIERFPRLERLDLFRCRKLSSLEAVQTVKNLRSLRIDQCPTLSDLSSLSRLRELRVLEIENCKGIQSIKPITKCRKLRRLQMAGKTTILDGDISCLNELPGLKTVLLTSALWAAYSAHGEAANLGVRRHLE